MALTTGWRPDLSQVKNAGFTGPMNMQDYTETMRQAGFNSWDTAAEQMAEARKAYDRAQGVADTVSGRALDDSAYFSQAAREDRDAWKRTALPGMEDLMGFARGYTTPERMMANRAAAGATVARGTQAGMDAATRDLMSHNIDPSSGSYVGLREGLAAQKAAAQAGAMTKSDRDTEQLGQQYLTNAINAWSGIPGQAVNESGLGMTQGNTALNAQLAPANSYFQWSGTAPDWSNIGTKQMQLGNEAYKAQTEAGQRANELQEKIEERKSKEGSGLGAGIGAALGGLGTLSSFIPGWGTAASIGLKGASGIAGAASKMAARGGLIEKFADGGVAGGMADDEFDWEDDEATPGVEGDQMVTPDMSPSGGAETDDVHAMLNEGEFVIPKDVTSWLGEKFFQKLIEKSRAEAAGPQEAEPEEVAEPPPSMAFAPTFRSERAGGQRGVPFMQGAES